MEKPAAAAAVILFDRIERSRAARIMSIDLKQGNSQGMQENIIILISMLYLGGMIGRILASCSAVVVRTSVLMKEILLVQYHTVSHQTSVGEKC